MELLNKKKSQGIAAHPAYAYIVEERYQTEMDVVSRFSKMDSAFSWRTLDCGEFGSDPCKIS